MYELSRIRVCSAGPAGARFQDVILDFSGAGQPVAAVQGDLFGARAQGLRPSPASVVFLENGGGKSVLLKLAFSVLLPGRQRVKDAPDPRLLEDYVLAKDVSHIALEWMHAITGKLLVTAKALCWKDQVVSTVAENLIERWYAFFPTETLGLDTLPVVEEGQYVALPTYRDRVNELYAQDQRLAVNWPKSQGDWTELLGQLGLDPELFRYQRAMNRDEGEAVHAFTLESDGGFVDFLLEAVFDHQGLNDLAALVSKYAHKLAGRKDLALELAFVEQAMVLLEPLIDAADAVHEAQKQVQRAGTELAAFHGQVKARVRDDQDRVSLLERQLEGLAGEFKRASRLTRRWAATVAGRRERLAQLQVERAKADAEEASRRRREAKTVADGWRATAAVERHLTRSDALRSLALLVKKGELAVAPALAARERAAGAFAQGLLALRQAAASAQEKELEQAGVEAAAEKQARGEREAALKKAGQAEAKASGLLEQVAAARTDAEEAVAAGLAPATDLVPAAAADARRAVDLASEQIKALELEREGLDQRQIAVQETLSAAIREEEAACGRRTQAQRALDTARSRARAIEATPRLTDLLGTEVRLDLDAHALLDRLETTIAEAERERVAVQIELARDEFARLALADGRMLPPPEVVRDACRLLEQSEPRIDAWPGWEYLTEFPLQQREEMLARAPHLVSGVLLNSPDDLERAREILGRGAPTAYYVTVGAVAGLLESADAPTREPWFTLPFNVALYQEKAAQTEQKVIEERWARSEERLKQLHFAHRHDGQLRQRISQWRQDYPEGALAGLQEALTIAGTVLEEAEKDTAQQQLFMNALVARRDGIRDELHDAQGDLDHWQKVSRRLTELSERLTQMPSWLQQAADAETEQGAWQKQADEAEATADEHRRLAEGHRAAGDEQRRAAAAAGREWAALPGANDMRLDAEPPSDPVPVLRDAYEKAEANFNNADVPGTLRERLAQAEARAAEAAAEYSALDETDRATARRLLQTPESLDERSRAEAQERADRTLEAAEAAVTQAVLEQGKHENALSERHRELHELTADGTATMPAADLPDTIEGCLQSVAAAETEHAAAQAAQTGIGEQQSAVAQEAAQAKDAAGAFANLAQALADTAAEPDAAPYVGDGKTGWSDYGRLRGAAEQGKKELSRTEKVLRSATEKIKQHAAAERYAGLSIPVRQQITNLSPEKTAEHAADWLAALQPRKRNLADEIHEVDLHRQTIVDHLKGESDKALSLLRLAQRLSRLPRTLGDWAGQEFIHFSFQPQPDELLLPRLGELAEEAAAGRTTDGRKVARDGLSLLLRAVHTAVPGGFKVQVLKPDTVLRAERVRVSKVKDVFSGGQQLTAAILLYCTMAALRANQQGRERSRHAGVLFLDNPIGRANADYLLDLQREVAQALGVQLVYTTGLYDEKALGKFPLIVRLRNDADLRAARKYLVVDDMIRRHLDALAPEDGTGQIDSARIFRREEPPHEGPEGNDGTATPRE
ncbi:hypothetical protein OG554_19035 [Streptomyces griseus]|uniref:hypothetical protein n=1 Tax=Streptomyces griseus TaxID=1911 RepID=UPI0038665602|nr:hypothetical protein OG554_19035 [Streptomyces fimicarius]